MSSTMHPVVSGLRYTESPRWRDGRLWFSDFYEERVFSVREDGSDLRDEATVAQQPSGLGWLPDGRLLIVSMRDQRVLRRELNGELAVHADLSSHMVGWANDMIVDAEGRAYVGSFGFDLMGGAPMESASLLKIDPDGRVAEVATDLWFPNGMAITARGVLLVNETFANRVSAFDIGPDGSLGERRTWAEFAPLPTERELDKVLPQLLLAPDGGDLDEEGGFWVADAMHGRVVRVAEGGEITATFTPGTGAFACAVGGDAGKTLFACIAPDSDEKARRAAREAEVVAVAVADVTV